MNLDKMFDIGIIAQLAYQISTTTKADVFFNYSSHVQSIRLQVYEHGWHEESIGESITLYLKSPLADKKEMEATINKLEGMLKK